MKSIAERRIFVRRRQHAAAVALAILTGLAVVAMSCLPAKAAEHSLPPQAQVAAGGGPFIAPQLSLNAPFRKLAMLQSPWSPQTWVLHANSGQTGGNGAYGYTWVHMLTQAWVSDVIECYAARPAYYDGAQFRRASYLDGSRPKTWAPEGPGDMLTGEWKAPDGTQVSGPDFEHFALGPLFAVADSHGFTVQTSGGPRPAERVAREMLRHLLRAHAGMLRTPYGTSGFVSAGRQIHWVASNLVAGAKRDLLDPADRLTLSEWMLATAIPWMEASPETRVYNGHCWSLPVIYDLWTQCPDRAIRARLLALMQSEAQLLWRLTQLAPGRACQVEKVETWGPELTAAGVTITPYYEPWEIRPMLIAAAVLGEDDKSHSCAAEADAAIARWRGKPEALSWLVDAGGMPLGDL